ncbi:hypothetical protein P8452_55837 [Trifolium repens]|nr:hypothetical protein P8452_55837 [Trifolium repens]
MQPVLIPSKQGSYIWKRNLMDRDDNIDDCSSISSLEKTEEGVKKGDDQILTKGKEVLSPINIEDSEDSISNNSLENHTDAFSADEIQRSNQIETQATSSNPPILKKQGIQNKLPHGCGPKFLKLAEAVKDGGGGGRRQRQQGAVEVGWSRSVPTFDRGRPAKGVIVQAESDLTPNNCGGDDSGRTMFHLEGLILELVLSS